MTFLVWLQSTAFAQWVSGSLSLWAYPTILTAHALGMGIVVGVSWLIALRVLGVGRSIPLAPLEGLYPVMWIGFGINAVSGTALFAAAAVSKAQNPLFSIKMSFVVLALATMVALKTRVLKRSERDGGQLPPNARLLAWASLTFWTGAIVAGRLMAYLGNGRG